MASSTMSYRSVSEPHIPITCIIEAKTRVAMGPMAVWPNTVAMTIRIARLGSADQTLLEDGSIEARLSPFEPAQPITASL
jgi:hypothetical protein